MYHSLIIVNNWCEWKTRRWVQTLQRVKSCKCSRTLWDLQQKCWCCIRLQQELDITGYLFKERLRLFNLLYVLSGLPAETIHLNMSANTEPQRLQKIPFWSPAALVQLVCSCNKEHISTALHWPYYWRGQALKQPEEGENLILGEHFHLDSAVQFLCFWFLVSHYCSSSVNW